MTRTETLFLEAFGASLKPESVNWTEPPAPEEWIGVFRLAAQHRVLPMVYEAVYRCPAAKTDPAPAILRQQKPLMLQTVMLQTQKTAEFLDLYRALQAAGLHPLVVKGLVCRALYPKPDLRLSGDEDLLVSPEEFSRCHEALLAQGLIPADETADPGTACEIAYARPGSPIYIELHEYLFPPEAEAYGDLNRYFAAVHEHPAELSVDGVTILTLQPTDHLFYLICHAFKHFLHSGVGIRQVADIALYANAYGTEIDWPLVHARCREIRAERFAAALLAIGEKHLTLDPAAACLPPDWRTEEVDEEPLLADILAAGVYGDSSMSRKHSSTMTLNAVKAEKQGRRGGVSFLRSVFPPLREMEAKYPYLRAHPARLPAAWVSRILHYRKETAAGGGGNNAADSLRIGSQRVDLLKEYGVIEGRE